MKKLFLTAFLLSILALKVISQTATVTVFSQEGEKFWVIANGIKQNEKPTTNVKVTGLSSPNYRFKILFADEKIPAIDKNIFTMNPDQVFMDQTYILKKDKKGEYVMRLNSSEPSKGIVTTEPDQISVPFTTVERVQQTTVTTTNSNDNPNVGVYVKDPVTGESVRMNMSISETGAGVGVNDPTGANINMNIGIRDNTTNQTTITSTTTTTTTTTYGQDNREIPLPPSPPPRPSLPGYNGPIGCEYPITPQDFDDALKTISSKSFEDSKLTIAKQITAANCLFTSQVKDIMKLFSFEDSKLDFAKYAYHYTFDIGNYFKVNDAFTFEASINDLNEYISTHKR